MAETTYSATRQECNVADSNNQEIIHRTLDTGAEEPVEQVAETIAELEGEPVENMTPLYNHLDHILDRIFSDPPADEAEITIEFTYEEYRITVEQNGHAEFVET